MISNLLGFFHFVLLLENGILVNKDIFLVNKKHFVQKKVVHDPNGRPDHLLFGHLTPSWLLKELNVLKSYHSIEKVKIIVTHIKPEKGAREKIIKQLESGLSDSNLNFIFPQQGEAIWL